VPLSEQCRLIDLAPNPGVDPFLLLTLPFLPSLLRGLPLFGHAHNAASECSGVPAGLAALRQVRLNAAVTVACATGVGVLAAGVVAISAYCGRVWAW